MIGIILPLYSLDAGIFSLTMRTAPSTGLALPLRGPELRMVGIVSLCLSNRTMYADEEVAFGY